MRKWLLVVGIIGLGIAVAIYIVMTYSDGYRISEQKSSLIDTQTLQSLDRQSASNITTSKIDQKLTPPTNKWYSGMLLNDTPQPGFNTPNSILLRNDGFEIGLPTVSVNRDGVYAPHTPGIRLTAVEATSYKLTRYDELTMTVTYYAESNKELFNVTFASGSPYGFVLAKQDVQFTLTSGAMQNTAGGLTTFKQNAVWYGVKTSNDTTGGQVRLERNDRLAVFSATKQADTGLLASLADHAITSGQVKYRVDDSKITTTLTYVTTDKKPSLLVRMPHQLESDDQGMKYSSLYGDLSATQTNTITYTQPKQQYKWSLSLDDITATDKTTLVSQLESDISTMQFDKQDTYFGGKQLQRAAQLVMVADAVNEESQRKLASKKLVAALDAWFDDNDERSFYYDTEAKTMVGREASFGADKELNDHHFHYGYFVYAASVAAKFDSNFLKRHEHDINLLVADIANYSSGEDLMQRRNFDAYAGHSWASGLANYGDGNNQESSGEAVNAWTAVGLWGEVSENNTLIDEASWLLANEIEAAKKYWLAVPSQSEYASPLVSINWGGKREYKTFFSDEANAKLAIQLLPMNPTMKKYISKLPDSIYAGTDTQQLYGDYILMARGRESSLQDVASFPTSSMDGGNSKSYMMAYILSADY